MLVSLKNNIALLAMPKTGTTALEAALAPQCDIIHTGEPRIKHMPLRRFDRFMRPYLAVVGAEGIETACLFRHPEAWLGSWYRYRARPALRGHPNSTADMDFERFVTSYLAETPPDFARVGRPWRFVTGRDGQMGVTHVFAYEDMAGYCSFLEARFGMALRLERLNVSPSAPLTLSATLRSRLEDALADDYALHASLPVRPAPAAP